MTHGTRTALVALLVACVLPAWAQGPPHGMGGPGMPGAGPPPGPPAFLAQVFPPNLVMEHQEEIGLRPAQVDAIKKAMNEAQQRLLDVQWKLASASEALTRLLASDHVDEAAVLAKLDEVTGIEQQVKKENFTLLVRIKNLLDPQQQAKLRAMRPSHPMRPPDGPPPPP